jgi:hypothetical protein
MNILFSISGIYSIFERAVNDYHKWDDLSHSEENPYETESLEALMYHKAWIDTQQWHMEDVVRNPNIEASEGLRLKREIDASNQRRTDTVEKIDDYYMAAFENVVLQNQARLNTESVAWALDRLSILALKIYHMKLETARTDASLEHIEKCQQKWKMLIEQKADLKLALEQLLEDLLNGKRIMKVYRQMKMYNDPSLNPVLYNNAAQ